MSSKLTDILSSGGGGGNFDDFWNSTEAAQEFAPIPPGKYVARIVRGGKRIGRMNGTLGYQLEFVVIEGPHANRKLWHDLWLTDKAGANAKRYLAKLGVNNQEEKFDSPLPAGFICSVQVALRKDDDGTERNRVRSFEVLRIETPVVDPFAPDDSADDCSPDGVPF